MAIFLRRLASSDPSLDFESMTVGGAVMHYLISNQDELLRLELEEDHKKRTSIK
jgi:hypothetical protein